MNVIICGGRNKSPSLEEWEYTYLDYLHKLLGFDCVIQGGANSAEYWQQMYGATECWL